MQWLRVVVVCLAAATVGCGQSGKPFKTATVAGTVKLDGAPIEKGTINFISDQVAGAAGGEASADIVAGRFTAADVPLGKVRAYVIANKETGKMIHGSSEMIPEIASIVPAQYREGIPLEITGNETDRVIDLVSESKP